MKKLLAIALIASLTIGSAAQAKDAKPMKKAVGFAVIKPVKPITDPNELNKQINKIRSKMRKTFSKKMRFFADRTRAANKGNLKEMQEFDQKVRHKTAKMVKQATLARGYTLRLGMAKAQEKAKEVKKEKPKKARTVKKEKTKK